MLSDTDRLTETVEQVLRAGRAGDKKAGREKSAVDFRQLVRECMDAVRTRHHLAPESIRYEERSSNGAPPRVLGSSEDLRTAIFNVLDNAIKYSGEHVDVRVRLYSPDEKRVVLSVRDHGSGYSSRRYEKHLQALLPREPPCAGACQGNWSGIIYRKVDRTKARRESFRRKRGRRQGNHDHDGAAEVFIMRASVMRASIMRESA